MVTLQGSSSHSTYRSNHPTPLPHPPTQHTHAQALATTIPIPTAASSDAILERRLRGSVGSVTSLFNSSIFLSDDFDAYPLGPLSANGPWSNLSSGLGTVIVAVKEDDGSKAIKCMTAPGEGGKTAFLSLRPSVVTSSSFLGAAFYGRFRFFLEAAPTQHDLHWTFIQAMGSVRTTPDEEEKNKQQEDSGGANEKEEAAAAASYRMVYRFGGQLAIEKGSQLMVNLDTPDFYGGKGPGSDCWVQGHGAVMPAGRWVCAEFSLEGQTANVGMRLWLDGEEIQALHVEPTAEWRGDACVHQDAVTYTWPAPTVGFEGLSLGWESYNEDEVARVLWLDDVVLSRDRIGCGGE